MIRRNATIASPSLFLVVHDDDDDKDDEPDSASERQGRHQSPARRIIQLGKEGGHSYEGVTSARLYDNMRVRTRTMVSGNDQRPLTRINQDDNGTNTDNEPPPSLKRKEKTNYR